MLDEECLVPNGRDRSYNNKLCLRHSSKLRFSEIKTNPNWFIINHFAGSVSYCSDGFLDKNKDLLSDDAQIVIKESKNTFVSNLFANFLNRGITNNRRRRSHGMITISSTFRDQLNDLMDRVDITEPHFIRCIKPNNQNIPNVFTRSSVNEQLRYGGVLQAVQVSRAGYPVRMLHEDFILDYIFLISHEEWPKYLLWKNREKGSRALAISLLKRILELYKIPVAPEGFYMWAVGKTKCFFKTEAFEVLSSFRGKIRNAAAVKIQAIIKGNLQQRSYETLRRITIYIQSWIRSYLCKKELQNLRREKAALILQTNFRMHRARSRYQRRRAQIIKFQLRCKNVLEMRHTILRDRNKKAVLIQSTWRMFVERKKYLNLQFWLRVFTRRINKLIKRQRLLKLSEGYKIEELLLENETLKTEIETSEKCIQEGELKYLKMIVTNEKATSESKKREDKYKKNFQQLTKNIACLEKDIDRVMKEKEYLNGEYVKQKNENSHLLHNITVQEKSSTGLKHQINELENEKQNYLARIQENHLESVKNLETIEHLQGQLRLADQKITNAENNVKALQKPKQIPSKEVMENFLSSATHPLDGKTSSLPSNRTLTDKEIFALQRKNEELIEENEKLRRMKTMNSYASADLHKANDSTPSLALIGWKESDKRYLFSEFLDARDVDASGRFDRIRPFEGSDESVWISLRCIINENDIECFDCPENDATLLDDPHSINVYSRVAFLFIFVNASARKTFEPVKKFFKMLETMEFVKAKIFLIYFSRETRQGNPEEVSRTEVDELAALYNVEVKEIAKKNTAEIFDSCLNLTVKSRGFMNTLGTKIRKKINLTSVDISSLRSLIRSVMLDEEQEKEFLRPSLPAECLASKGGSSFHRIFPFAIYEASCPFQRLAMGSSRHPTCFFLAIGGSNGIVQVIKVHRTQKELRCLQSSKENLDKVTTTSSPVESDEIYAMFDLSGGKITSLFFIQDDKYLIVASRNSNIYVINMETKTREKQYKDSSPVLCCIPIPSDFNHIVSITEKSILRILSLTLDMGICREALDFIATTMTFDKTGTLLFIGSDNGRVHCFSVSHEKKIASKGGLTVSEAPIFLLDIWLPLSNCLSSAALLLVGTGDGSVSTYPLNNFISIDARASPNWSCRTQLPNHVVSGCNNHVCGNWYVFGTESRQIMVLSREDSSDTNPKITSHTIGRNSPLSDVLVSTDGFIMACTLRGGVIELFRRSEVIKTV
nr:myosin 2 [Cardiosporidium cionae]